MSPPVIVAIPATVVEAPKPPAPSAGFDAKGFFVQSEDGVNRLEVGFRVQPRFTYEVRSGKAKDRSYFAVNRGDLRLSGNVLAKELGYKFEADFGKGTVALRDFYADYAFIPGAFQLRVGQFKKPWSRQGIASSGNLQTTDRAISDSAFGSGRDQGIMLHNAFDKSPAFEWALGLFNGTGEKPWFTDAKGETAAPVKGTITGAADDDGVVTGTSTGTVASDAKFTLVPKNARPQLVGRLGFNHGDVKGYSEADLEGGPFRLGVAASGSIDFDSDGGNDSEAKTQIDAILKVEGFSFTGGYYISSAQAGAGFGDRAFGKSAYHAQLGYVIAGKVEPVVRISQLFKAGPANNESEYTAGIGFYPFKHSFKWQTDVSVLQHEATDKADTVIRSQIQIQY